LFDLVIRMYIGGTAADTVASTARGWGDARWSNPLAMKAPNGIRWWVRMCSNPRERQRRSAFVHGVIVIVMLVISNSVMFVVPSAGTSES
jgi:hypothetical protein